MRKECIEAYIEEHAKVKPQAPAIVVRGEVTSYQKLWEMVRGFALCLGQCGVTEGDVVVVKASQTLSYALSYFGTHLAHAVFAPAEKSVTLPGLDGFICETQAKVCITDKWQKELTERHPELVCLMPSDVVKLARDAYDEESMYTFPDADDSADIFFTTGTTGSSKGVEIQHHALVATAENLIFGCGYKPDNLICVPGPLNHVNPVRKLFTSMVNGSAAAIFNGMLNMKALFDTLDTWPYPVSLCLPPAMVRTILQNTGDKLGEYKDKIDFIESASAPLPEPDKLKLCELLPRSRLYNNYGSSESASVCMYDYQKYPGLVGCVGEMMPNSRIFITDDDGNEIASSKEHPGLIACEGDVNMKGYYHAPELTADVLRGGVVYTNDIGYIGEHGFVYIIGRKGDVINVGGLKVAPNEVEEVVLAFDGIRDCICVPMADAVSGQTVRLWVVPEDAAKFDRRALVRFLGTRLEKYKIPTVIDLTDEVPRTYNGKIDRKRFDKETGERIR